MTIENIPPHEFLHWMQLPETKTFMGQLRNDRAEIMEAWANKQYTSDTIDQTIMLNMKGIAQVETIDQILQNLESCQESAREAVKQANERKK